MPHKIEVFSDGAIAESVKGAWNNSSPGSKCCPQSPKPQTCTIIITAAGRWVLWGLLYSLLLAPIHYSLSLLCLHTFSAEDNMLFWGGWVSTHRVMSSKKLVLPNTYERNWNMLPFLMLAAVQWSQWWPQWCQEWERRAAAGCCACLMNHHILPTRGHPALQVRARNNLKDFTAKLAYVFWNEKCYSTAPINNLWRPRQCLS